MTPEEAKATFKRNDPCFCKSGVPYKFCHQAVLEAPLDKVLEVGQSQYAHAWATNSGHYEARGYYAALTGDCMAALEPRRLLDVGCGLGQGLKALAAAMPAAGRLLVGLDENPRCIDGAAAALRGAGIYPLVVRRLRGVPIPGGRHYDLVYEPGQLAIGPDVSLIQSDVFEDPELDAMLSSLPPFDAVTLWFTGVHKARQGLSRLAGVHVDSAHREQVEAAAFAMARRILRPGGGIHLAERAWSTDFDALIAKRLDDLRPVAAGFRFLPSVWRPYTEPTNLNRIGVGSKEHNIRASDVTAAILSIVAVKT